MNFNFKNTYLKKFQNVDEQDFLPIHDSDSPFTLEFPTSYIGNKAVLSVVTVTRHEQHPYIQLSQITNEIIDNYQFTFDINKETINQLHFVSIQYRWTKKQQHKRKTFEANTAILKVEVYDKHDKLIETKFSNPIRNINYEVSEDAIIASVDPDILSRLEFTIQLKYQIPYFPHEVFVKINDSEFPISSEDDFPIRNLLLEVPPSFKQVPNISNVEIIFRICPPEQTHEGLTNATPTIEQRKKKKSPNILSPKTQMRTLISKDPRANCLVSPKCDNSSTIVPIPEANKEDEEKLPELCLVISYTNFENHISRDIGKGKDENGIDNVFTNILHYNVIHLNNYKTARLITKINEIIKSKIKPYHQNVVVFVLSHGDNGIFFTYDGNMNTEDLVELFLPTNCTALNNRPKIFYFSCCRGTKENGNSSQVLHELGINTCDAGPENTAQNKLIRSIPSYHNVFKGYSTTPGYCSKRMEDGTVYIQELLAVIMEKPRREIRKIHDNVQKRMYEKVTKEHNYMIPEASNSLVRCAYFKQW